MFALYLLLLDELLLLLLLPLAGASGGCGWLTLCSHWLRAHEGNWQWWRAVLMCVRSFSNLSWVEDTVLALWARVLYTLCLPVMWWLLSQWTYWSVCVGFL